MIKDGVNSKIKDAVFVVEAEKNISGKDPLNSALLNAEENLVVKYRKILQMGIPAEKRSHLKDFICSVRCCRGKKISSEDPLKSELLKAEEELVVKYRKMLQMGISADGEGIK
jgi:hypothetical protein